MNNKNSILKSVISIGFDKTGKIQSYVNKDRIKKILGDSDNSKSLVNEVELLRKYLPSLLVASATIPKSKLAEIKKTVKIVKAKATRSNTLKSPLNKAQTTKVKNFIKKGEILGATKYVKEVTNLGLKDSKVVVDSFFF